MQLFHPFCHPQRLPITLKWTSTNVTLMTRPCLSSEPSPLVTHPLLSPWAPVTAASLPVLLSATFLPAQHPPSWWDLPHCSPCLPPLPLFPPPPTRPASVSALRSSRRGWLTPSEVSGIALITVEAATRAPLPLNSHLPSRTGSSLRTHTHIWLRCIHFIVQLCQSLVLVPHY